MPGVVHMLQSMWLCASITACCTLLVFSFQGWYICARRKVFIWYNLVSNWCVCAGSCALVSISMGRAKFHAPWLLLVFKCGCARAGANMLGFVVMCHAYFLHMLHIPQG